MSDTTSDVRRKPWPANGPEPSAPTLEPPAPGEPDAGPQRDDEQSASDDPDAGG